MPENNEKQASASEVVRDTRQGLNGLKETVKNFFGEGFVTKILEVFTGERKFTDLLSEWLGIGKRDQEITDEENEKEEQAWSTATAYEEGGQAKIPRRRKSPKWRESAALSYQKVNLAQMTKEQVYAFSKDAFPGDHGNSLLVQLDKKFSPDGQGAGVLVKRMIALGWHEGRLQFRRQNADPARGKNTGTFQINAASQTLADNRYEGFLRSGIEYYNRTFSTNITRSDLSPADMDILAHVAYIDCERGGKETFRKLADPNLSDEQLITLMHHKIQGGIRAIGESVVAQTRGTQGTDLAV